MREIDRLTDEKEALLIGDILYVKGITNQVDATRDGTWTIWVHDDARITEARQLLELYKNDPSSPEFSNVAAESALKKKKDMDDDAHARKNIIDGRNTVVAARVGLVTSALIGMCVIITLLSNFGSDEAMADMFRITKGTSMQNDLPEVMAGQAWRLVTPIFLHLGFLHLLFNVLFTKDLGSMIERRHGSLFLLIMVLVMATLSNAAQFLVTGPHFGGISGVVFGMLGYLWIRNKTDSFYDIQLNSQTIALMIAWFFLGYVVTWLNMANTAHAVGLGLGMAFGFVSGKIAIFKRFKAN